MDAINVIDLISLVLLHARFLKLTVFINIYVLFFRLSSNAANQTLITKISYAYEIVWTEVVHQGNYL